MARSDLTAALLRAMLNYNPDTGHLTWRHGYAKPRFAGCRAGGMGSGGSVGYRVIYFVKYGVWNESRLAWLHHYGEHPAGVVDHINGVRDDNRISNLRDVTHAQNLQNITRPRKSNRSGYLGVQTQTDGRYIVQIEANGVRHYVGFFTCPKAAHEAYKEAKRRLHVTCTI
jgi:hypothetical protein